MSHKFRNFSVTTLALTGLALIGTSFVPKAHADAWDKMTYVTINEPIIAGNKVLDPGTYVWRLLDSQSDRHVVQIFDKDQQHLQTTILAIPNYRLQPTGKTTFAFWETPAGVPKAVKDWFYPGDNFGQEFPYPKKLVAQLASAAPVPVPTNYREPEPVQPEPQPEAQPAPQPETQPAPAPEPTPQPEPQPQPEAAPVQQPQSLPHTGSFDPLIGLLGLTSLSFAGLLTLATRRS
ncbi:MAG TPA: LPXTG cell wall anchor domain-containing protein [Bryobacteraceae bacterium]|jgi:LPXTG-motif cell wall-anchored protein|nr:LPXTG cell wall anchor domain-containing protein [Bryobacteraceae bacterium]